VILSGLERHGGGFRGSCAGCCTGGCGRRGCRPRRQGGRTRTRRRRCGGRRGVQGATTGKTILALLLGVQVRGVVLNTLTIVVVADVEWDGVLVERDIGDGAIDADAVEGQGILRLGQLLVIPEPELNRRNRHTESQSLEDAAPPQICGQVLRSPWHQLAGGGCQHAPFPFPFPSVSCCIDHPSPSSLARTFITRGDKTDVKPRREGVVLRHNGYHEDGQNENDKGWHDASEGEQCARSFRYSSDEGSR
jgi:hypothetical protein